MITRPFFAWVFALLLMIASGCGDRKAPQPEQAAPARKAVPAPPTGEKPVAADEQPSVPMYKYDPTGRRDPFTPLMAVRKLIPGESDTPMTPLQSFDVSQLRLVAVIIGKGAPRAMVIGPDGKGYILQKGIKVGKNNGTVIAIRNEAVLVKERYYDLSGEVRENTVEIQVPKREGV